MKKSLCSCRHGDQGIAKHYDCPVHGQEVRQQFKEKQKNKTMYITLNRPSASYILVNEANPPGEFTFNGRSVALLSINGDDTQYEIRWKVRATSTDPNDLAAIKHFKLEPAYEICKPSFVEGTLEVISEEAQLKIKERLEQCCTERNLDGFRMRKKTPGFKLRKSTPSVKWLAIEREFLIGVNTCLQALSGGDITKISSQMPPAWVVCMMTNRSILE